GLYKKLLLADMVPGFAIAVYSTAEKGLPLTCFDAWLGTLAFALQIYFDFSYRAGSIVEFWGRWHMTLTRFLREYVYFTLGGNRCGPWRHAFNILATMLLSGLWHGAGWTFVIWGGLHGSLLVVAHAWRSWSPLSLPAAAGWALTFTAVIVAWVVFRANDLTSAGHLLGGLTGLNGFLSKTPFA